MRNQTDGGEAVLQAFRSLGVDYVMSSPGSEWGAVWEALASQKLTNSPGPTYLSCAHETLAVNLAIGYTYVTGRMQAVMLHTGVGLLQGTMGIDYAQRHGIPMLVVSGESLSYGDNPDFDPGAQWQSILSAVGGPVRLNISSRPDGVSGERAVAELNRLGLEHFGFGVDDLAAELKKLAEAGVRVVLPLTEVVGGARLAYIEGPDDVLIELVQSA